MSVSYTKTQYDKVFDLYYKYSNIVLRPLTNDEDALNELVAICDTDEK